MPVHRPATRARPLLLVAAATLAVGGLAGCSSGGVPELSLADAAQAPAPPRDAHLAEGGWPELAAWVARENRHGRPVVVNYFASWCAPCRDEAPLLRELAARYPDVAFLGIATRDRREDSERFLKEEQLGFPTLWDWHGDSTEAVEAKGMPTTVLFDHEGQLVFTHTGVLTEEMVEPRLADLAAASVAAA